MDQKGTLKWLKKCTQIDTLKIVVKLIRIVCSIVPSTQDPYSLIKRKAGPEPP
nr:MAG TPA: hypothetical protein [Caudoviricetes sp.]